MKDFNFQIKEYKRLYRGQKMSVYDMGMNNKNRTMKETISDIIFSKMLNNVNKDHMKKDIKKYIQKKFSNNFNVDEFNDIFENEYILINKKYFNLD